MMEPFPSLKWILIRLTEREKHPSHNKPWLSILGINDCESLERGAKRKTFGVERPDGRAIRQKRSEIGVKRSGSRAGRQRFFHLFLNVS